MVLFICCFQFLLLLDVKLIFCLLQSFFGFWVLLVVCLEGRNMFSDPRSRAPTRAYDRVHLPTKLRCRRSVSLYRYIPWIVLTLAFDFSVTHLSSTKCIYGFLFVVSSFQ